MASTSQPFWLALILIALIAGLQPSTGRSLTDMELLQMKQMHEKWMVQYGRVYKHPVEKEARLEIFKENFEFVQSFNNAGKKPYKLGINAFSDMTNAEFKASRTGLRPSMSLQETSFMYENATDIPSSIDWRKKGAVTPVKSQGSCGGCWAFSTVAAIEGITAIRSGNLVSLSEQELLDCDTMSRGCDNGHIAFDFVIQHGGRIATEESYPYTTMKGTCGIVEKPTFIPKITGFERVPENDEKALLMAVSQQPVSVLIDFSSIEFQHYSSGVFTGGCNTTLNHALTAVGYGTTDDGTKYWLVKNSWGTEWGEEGYARMERDVEAKEGLCGIAIYTSYPTV